MHINTFLFRFVFGTCLYRNMFSMPMWHIESCMICNAEIALYPSHVVGHRVLTNEKNCTLFRCYSVAIAYLEGVRYI